MLLALVLIPGCVAFWGTRPLDEAVLCTTPVSGSLTDLRGYLVGQTTDNALIGDMSGPDRRVTSVPNRRDPPHHHRPQGRPRRHVLG